MKKTIAILFALLFCLLAAVMTAGAEGELSDVPQFDSTEAVAAFIRTEMVSRSAEIRFKATDEAVAAVTLADVCEHTGNGTEGDYLRLALNYALPQIEKGADGVFVLRPTYYTTAEQEATVGAYAESALAGCTAEDDAQTARYIYDYLCEKVAFDLENLYNDEDLLKYTAYGAAVNGRAVCQGFATLYYRLALAAGLDCRIVTGARGDVAHAWNIVKIGDQWYHLDSSSGAQLLDNAAYFMKRIFDGYTIHYGDETAPEVQGYRFVIGNEDETINAGTLIDSNISWELNITTGALAITGTGEMPTFSFNSTPFGNKINIKSVVISEGITNIADYLFYDYSNLAEISIPSTVTSIGMFSFAMCPIESIYLGEDNPVFCLRGNCLIHMDEKVLRIGTSNSVIPNDGSVDTIGRYAFYKRQGLKRITLPDSLKLIGPLAFYECTELKELHIPSSVTAIDHKAFYMCTALETLTFSEPDNHFLHISAGYNFYGCSKLTEIDFPKGTTKIGPYAFADCTELKHLSIPKETYYIDPYTFDYCGKLESITVDSENSKYHSDSNCLIETGTKQLIAGCYNSVIPDDGSVTRIGPGAYSGCEALTSIIIPENIEQIFGFNDCTGLTEITIPSKVERIENAFNGCIGLTSIDIPACVRFVGGFNDCTRLTEVAVPENVEIIESAFNRCSGLAKVTISATKQINDSFQNCTGLTEVTIPGNVEKVYRSFDDCTGLVKVIFMPGVIEISQSFNRCTGLTTLSFPNTVTTIAGGFRACSELTNVTFSEGLQFLDDFSFCTKLTSIRIPKTVETFGSRYSGTFDGCTGLTSVEIPEGVKQIGAVFNHCSGLTSVKIPEGIEFIKEAFNYCSGLTSVEIPDSVTTISHSFIRSSLASVTIPNSVTQLLELSFQGCKSITSVIIPESVIEMGRDVFAYCDNLQSVTILSPDVLIYDGKNMQGKACFQGIAQPCTIYGFAGSTAEAFAQDNNNPFIPLCSETNAPHNAQEVGATEPDCLTPGYSAGTVCLDCGEWLSGHEQTAEALGHAAGEPASENVVPATCTAEGSYDNVTRCTRCGELLASTPEKIAMLPHADDDHNGYCDDCGAYICEHPETALQNAKTVSCTENGYSGDTVCSWCGVTLEYGVTLQAPGHSPAISTPAKSATCLDPGMTAEYTCSACGDVTTAAQQTPIADHADGDGDGLCDVCLAPVGCNQYGRCGDSLFWYVQNNVLVISGSGETGELDAVPWSSCAEAIDCVYIRDSVTAMDGAGFAACPNLERVFAAAGTTVSRCEAPVLYYSDGNGVVTVSGQGNVPALDLPALLNVASVLTIDRTLTGLCFERVSLLAPDGGREIIYDILKNGKIIDENHFRLPSGTVLSAFSMKPLGYASFNSVFSALTDHPDRMLILSLSCEDLLPESLKSDSQSYTEQFVLHFVDEPQAPESPTKPEAKKTPLQQIVERFQATLAAILSVFKKLVKLFKK